MYFILIIVLFSFFNRILKLLKKIIKRESKIQLDKVYKRGYRIIPKLVMEDSNLSIEVKAIYSYLCSYTGGSNNYYPSISLQCFHLKMKI